MREIVPEWAQNKLKNDFEWYRSILKKPKDQRGYRRKDGSWQPCYENVDELDNQVVIDKFCNLKKEKGLEYFSDDLREAMKKHLDKKYVDR